MGLVNLRLKGNNICFLTDIQLFQCLAILFGLFNLSVCLFEDQIGKFDWKQNYVGQIKFAHFDTVSTAKKIIIATEENVVAALNFKSGQILWRQVLERAQHGQVQFLHVDSEVVSVSGQSPWLVRTWEPSTGRLLWEWSLSLTNPVRAKKILWFVSGGKLIQVVAAQGPVIEVTQYNVHTGQNKGGTSRISAPWVTDFSRCVMSGSIFACTSGPDSTSQLYYIDVAIEDSKVKTYPIQSLIGAVTGEINIAPLEGIVPGIIITRNGVNRIILIENGGPNALVNNIPAPSSILTMEYVNDKVLLFTSKNEAEVTVSAISIESGKEIPELSSSLQQPPSNSSLFAGLCAVKRDGNTACRYLLTTRDHGVHLVQNQGTGAPLWTREEALAHIVAVDMLDLPVSDLHASIETEFDNKEGDFWGMVVRRVVGQTKQLRLLFSAILGGSSNRQSAGTELVRDEFGLHKIIIAATHVGKLYGIDNLSGRIIWQRFIEKIQPFVETTSSEQAAMLLYVQRTTRHLPRPAQCLLIAKDSTTGNAVSLYFNPITGESVEEDLVRHTFKIKQALPFHKLNDDFLRPVLVLDEHLQIHVLPNSANSFLTSESAKQMFIYTADKDSGALDGYSVVFDDSGAHVQHTWRLLLGAKDQKISAVVGKALGERVHSQGRVLSDRSVLYKYVNPNLLAVVTQGGGAADIWLIDGVSGSVVASIAHRRVRGPVHLVHSENWLAYSYHNDKWRRSEVAAVELYEGQAQSNASTWSSLAPPPPPLVERQAYVLGAVPTALAVTRTDLGITAKHVLLALSSGAVLELPWLFLDPRRPAHATPEMREEGVVPYVPELPLPTEAVINYNQTLQRVRGIHTSSAGLESTCLVLVHGLDLFYTRVAPSKTFDLLKDDFDYYLIVLVLGALLLTSYVTKHLASRKALRQAWK